MNKTHSRIPFVLGLALVAAACSGGTSDTGTIFSGSFDLVSTEPLANGRLYLNDPIRFDFSTPVDIRSASLTTMSFAVLDLNGVPIAEQPTGQFEISTRPGDSQPGRRLLFIPTLPTNDTYDNGGYRPGRRYIVSLVGGDRRNNEVLLSTTGKGLNNPQSLQFETASATSAPLLFRNTKPGGPRKTAFSITPPRSEGRVGLSKLGSPTVEVRLSFDQPLNPNSGNVPKSLDTDPRVRSTVNKGRIFLEYDDVGDDNGVPVATWIPADVDIEANTLEGSTVLLRPLGVLPNNATIRVIVESTLEDIAGESNVSNVAYQRIFETFRTEESYEPQFDALVEQFTSAESIDFDAAFLEPQAEVGSGFVRASFDFEGGSTDLTFEPNTASVVLNTDFTQVTPSNGPAFNVSGGVFNFRSVTIPENVIVKGQGTRPMVWLVRDQFRVDGLLSVRGGDGARVDTLNSANFPTAGGVGVCGGGNGGKGSPSSTQRSPQGESGYGPNQAPNKGGGPGRLSCVSSCNLGSGGGGGSLSTQGDPYYKSQSTSQGNPPNNGPVFPQQNGLGGLGCTGNAGASGRSLPGGNAGPTAFTDIRRDNDFWGVGIDRNPQGSRGPIRIRGELATPVGGAGGGGGGDLAPQCTINDVNFINDNKGGGGGGGGGVLVVKCLGPIIIGPRGRIEADGGHGGGGEQAGSCNQGGGGGSGSGGMVILMSASRIEFNARGTSGTAPIYRYSENEYTFAISADGGICRTGQFLSPDIQGKYPASGQGTVLGGSEYDVRPLGGLGGMGIVQLMAPPGDPSAPNADGTNTVLDDNILVRRNNTLVTGSIKQQLLAWRGFPPGTGASNPESWVDDSGAATNINTAARTPGNEGDIRPTPILLPVPFNSVTRARSKWIDLGSVNRRPLVANDSFARGIIDPNGDKRGAKFEFASIFSDPANPLVNGYAQWEIQGSSAIVSYASILPGAGVPVQPAVTVASYRGQPAYLIRLTQPLVNGQPVLGNEADRYIGYEAQLLNGQGSVRASYRILGHTTTDIYCSQDGLLDVTGTTLQVRSKFFKVRTDGSEGLGGTYNGASNTTVPISNVRIGFAFHTNPDPAAAGVRFPAGDSFAYNLTDPAIQEQIRLLGLPTTGGATLSCGPRFVQWDIQFNVAYKSAAGDVNPRPFGPSSPRPELQFLRLPFRF